MTPRRRAVVLGSLAAAVTVTGVVLAARSPYIAALLEPGRPSPVAGQEVPDIAPAPQVRLAVVGDTGTGDSAQQSTAEQILAERGDHPYDALLLLGDLVYEEGDAELTHERVIEPYLQLTSAGTRLLPVLGNHDYLSGEQQKILSALGRTESWYVDELGPLRVVVLDSNQVDDPEQTRWLRTVLSAPQPAHVWTVVAMHHPPYSAGQHGSDVAVQDAWVPLFARFDVSLAFAGHDHDYQRSKPLDGVTYIVSGAGAKLRDTGTEDFTTVSSSTLHFVDLLVYDDRLVCRAIDDSGLLVDAFTIDR
jgi:3',5'-cyclic AMP phosphodiesterase CpdA